jgi:hypothetical protein
MRWKFCWRILFPPKLKGNHADIVQKAHGIKLKEEAIEEAQNCQ